MNRSKCQYCGSRIFYFIQPGCNCLSVSKTCLQSHMTKSSPDEAQYTADVSLFTHFGLNKSNLMWNKLPWHTDFEPFSKPHFMSHHLAEGTESYPKHSRCCPASIWPSEGCKGLLEGTDLLRGSIYGQNNLEQRFHFLTMFPTGYICNKDEHGQSNLFLWFLISDPVSVESYRQSLIHLLVLELNVWYFVI